MREGREGGKEEGRTKRKSGKVDFSVNSQITLISIQYKLKIIKNNKKYKQKQKSKKPGRNCTKAQAGSQYKI